MILKIKSPERCEQISLSRRKSIQGSSQGEIGSFNLLLLKIQLSIQGLPSLKLREFITFNHRN